jgi:hypothetical protein
MHQWERESIEYFNKLEKFPEPDMKYYNSVEVASRKFLAQLKKSPRDCLK